MAADAQQTLRRALCVLAVTDRAALEAEYKRVPYVERQRIEDVSLAVAAWLRREGLDEAVTPVERERLFGLVGSWTEEAVVELSWRNEALGVLSWALGLLDALPPYDRQCSLDFHGLYGVAEPVAAIAPRVRLRDESELAPARAEAQVWRDRAMRVERFHLRAMGWAKPGTTPPKGGPERIRAALREDAVLFGKPYETLDVHEYSVARSIALERLHAFRWLAEGGDWDAAVAERRPLRGFGVSPSSR